MFNTKVDFDDKVKSAKNDAFLRKMRVFGFAARVFFCLFSVAPLPTPAQKPQFQYWTEAYTRRHTFRDSLNLDFCEGYPVVEVGLGDSLRRYRAILSLASASYLSQDILQQEYRLRLGSPRTPEHHKLSPADLSITTLMDLMVGKIEFEGVDAFVADEGMMDLLRTCRADLVLGCNFLSAAVWAFYPEKKLAVVASSTKRIRFPASESWEKRWHSKLWSPFIWKKKSVADTSLLFFPEFSFGQPQKYLLMSETLARLKHKNALMCDAQNHCFIKDPKTNSTVFVESGPQRYHAWRFAGSRNEAVMTDLLNRKIYLARKTE